jgi:hypothetical protein
MALRERLKKVGKFALRAALGLALVGLVAHVFWVRSGDGEWKLVRDDDGIQIYTRKDPGSALLKFRSVARAKTSLSSVVFMYRGDESTANDFGGQNFRIFRRIETPNSYLSYYSVEQPMPPPFGTKEMVSMLNYAQDPKTGEVAINVQAAPSAMPPTPGVSRVTVLSNLFRITPMKNGEVQWEITLDADMGLFYPLANLALPDLLHQGTADQRKLLATEKYQKAKLLSVREF